MIVKNGSLRTLIFLTSTLFLACSSDPERDLGTAEAVRFDGINRLVEQAEICRPTSLLAFVFDTNTDGVEISSVHPNLSWDGTGNLGGVAKADQRCRTIAKRTGLKGKFKALLSSPERDFYAEMNPDYLSLPLRNVHGTILTGNTQTLDDLRDPTKNTLDLLWDSVMFFRANGKRVNYCGFPTIASYEAFTGMNPDGTPATYHCDGWTSAEQWGHWGRVTAAFDRGLETEIVPIEPASQTQWKTCTDIEVIRGHTLNSKNVLRSEYTFGPSDRQCNRPTDGLVCVQVEGAAVRGLGQLTAEVQAAEAKIADVASRLQILETQRAQGQIQGPQYEFAKNQLTALLAQANDEKKAALERIRSKCEDREIVSDIPERYPMLPDSQ